MVGVVHGFKSTVRNASDQVAVLLNHLRRHYDAVIKYV